MEMTCKFQPLAFPSWRPPKLPLALIRDLERSASLASSTLTSCWALNCDSEVKALASEDIGVDGRYFFLLS